MNNSFPFAEELVINTDGNVSKVIIKFDNYQHILEMLEDRALNRVREETEGKTPLSRKEALREL